jgi:bacillithiol system protein YtxJ
MQGWVELNSVEQFQNTLNDSAFSKIVIFKHSTRCSISSMAQRRLLNLETARFPQTAFLYLDLIAFRDVSNFISEHLEEIHQSPQILVVENGACIYDASHMEINVSELSECLT